jgi:RNA polymerase sigma-70 factor (family 1)
MPSSNLFYSQGADNDLFRLVKGGDLRAFEELYNRYWCSLVNAAYKRLNSKEKAEDIVQNIFVDIYQRRSTINLTISLKAYLFQALKFKVLNEFRSDAISAKYMRHLFFSTGCKTDLANGLEAKELEEKIQRIFNGLPKKCREVFRLSRQEELSNKEIATNLHVTISTVEKHISKALKTMGQQI